MWELLVLRDNWQGEFSVAVFAAIGWALISLMAAPDMRDMAAYATVRHILPEPVWELWLLLAGSLQLYGLRFDRSWFRTAGAIGCFMAFFSITGGLLVDAPGSRAVSLYFAVTFIEFCAIVYQVSRIYRKQEFPEWRWTFRL